LSHHLQQQEDATDGDLLELNNAINLESLDRLEKDLLRQSFQVVKDFKKHLSLRYRLGGSI
jgi:CBS domain-containing protein